MSRIFNFIFYPRVISKHRISSAKIAPAKKAHLSKRFRRLAPMPVHCSQPQNIHATCKLPLKKTQTQTPAAPQPLKNKKTALTKNGLPPNLRRYKTLPAPPALNARGRISTLNRSDAPQANPRPPYSWELGEGCATFQRIKEIFCVRMNRQCTLSYILQACAQTPRIV